MKIAVISIYNFPIGMAPTTRILSYCKGLLLRGANVDIVSLVPKNAYGNNVPLHGNCDGGNYYHFAYAPQCKIPIVGSILWRIKDRICTKRALRFIASSDKEKPYDAVILSVDEPSRFETLVPSLTRLNRAKLIAIADEYPIPIRHYLKTSVPESKLRRYRKVYAHIDARILMTTKLQEFYDTNVCKKTTLILSTIVDTDRFLNLESQEQERDYLCYMGNMELSKDNVDNIINAFSLIATDFPSLDLFLYGKPSEKTLSYLTNIVNKSNLSERVFFKGRVDYGQVPQILKNAKVLVSSQPNTKRAEGGFPTKLGEYMMTGVPTLLTNVGEISDYVKDGINAYLVPPERPELYADKLSYIITHYEDALSVASNAKQYIEDNFSMSLAGECISNFIKQLYE